jgi:hypothetical protein
VVISVSDGHPVIKKDIDKKPLPPWADDPTEIPIEEPTILDPLDEPTITEPKPGNGNGNGHGPDGN